MLYSCDYMLSPRQSQQLLYSRSINTHGLPGRNIAADLHMEHLNRACKDAIKGLGTNKTEKSIIRIGKAIGPLVDITTNFDRSILSKESKSSGRKVASSQKDMNLIMGELTGRASIFEEVPGRRCMHICVLKKSLFQKIDHKTFESWIEETINSWQ